MTDREFDIITRQLEQLNNQIKLLNEKLELYRQTGETQIQSIWAEVEAFQEANKQQLNVSLGVLVTAAIAILVSVILGMQ